MDAASKQAGSKGQQQHITPLWHSPSVSDGSEEQSVCSSNSALLPSDDMLSQQHAQQTNMPRRCVCRETCPVPAAACRGFEMCRNALSSFLFLGAFFPLPARCNVSRQPACEQCMCGPTCPWLYGARMGELGLALVSSALCKPTGWLAVGFKAGWRGLAWAVCE